MNMTKYHNYSDNDNNNDGDIDNDSDNNKTAIKKKILTLSKPTIARHDR